MMLRLRYFVRLLVDVAQFGSVTGSFWLLPLIVGLLLFFALVVTTHVAVPYVVYSFF